jgi:hypothetical protein
LRGCIPSCRQLARSPPQVIPLESPAGDGGEPRAPQRAEQLDRAPGQSRELARAQTPATSGPAELVVVISAGPSAIERRSCHASRGKLFDELKSSAKMCRRLAVRGTLGGVLARLEPVLDRSLRYPCRPQMMRKQLRLAFYGVGEIAAAASGETASFG